MEDEKTDKVLTHVMALALELAELQAELKKLVQRERELTVRLNGLIQSGGVIRVHDGLSSRIEAVLNANKDMVFSVRGMHEHLEATGVPCNANSVRGLLGRLSRNGKIERHFGRFRAKGAT